MQTFEGGHDWPPASVCAEALKWMELQATGRTEAGRRDEKLAEELFQKELERARASEAEGRTFEAYLGYAALARDFRGLRDVSEVERKAALLKDSKEVRRAARDEQGQRERQRVLEGNLGRLLAGPEDAGDAAESRAEFRHLVSDLLKDSAGQKDSAERRVARRVLGGAYVGLSQEASDAYRLKDYRRAALRAETAAELRPGDPHVFVFLARMYALRGDRKSALGALRRAVKSGLDDAAPLEQNKDFETLRDEPEFKKIVEAVRGRAK
jgi:tetratricopeptide (TPR) repeat protein